MATLAQKIETEKRTREFLEEGGLPQPDFVEYGFTCIRLFFESSKTVLVVDIDECPGGETETEAEGEAEWGGEAEGDWGGL